MKVGVRPEWRHFTPNEKLSILNAIVTNCEMSDVVRDFPDVTVHMANDTDFLVAGLTASLGGGAQLGAKFGALFALAVESVLVPDMERGGQKAEEVFERLLALAVERDAPEMLEELLELARRPGEHAAGPLLPWDPLPNSPVLAAACRKDSYALIKLLVDWGYRLKPYKMGDCGTKKDKVKDSRGLALLRLLMNRAGAPRGQKSVT